MDDLLLGYALNALDPPERRSVEAQLCGDPDARRRLDLVRRSLAPLAADREEPEPPPGLVARTLARITAVRSQKSGVRKAKPVILTPDPCLLTPGSGWRRADAFIAASILIMIGGLGVSGLTRLQQKHQVAVCQDNFRQTYASLAGYAGNHRDRFPMITEQPPRNFAAAYVPILAEAGCLPGGVAPVCPVVVRLPHQPAGVGGRTGYAYTLGYRDRAGELHGLQLAPGDQDVDYLPIMADVPAAASHQSGQNVLYLSGHVRFCTTSKVGVNGDEIYLNQFSQLAAGLHRRDTVLGDGDCSP
jgi:hypothetical protein